MISEWILYHLSKSWPSPVKDRETKLGSDPSKRDYHFKYSLHRQYLFKVKRGFEADFYEKRVLEIGCGHGGICVFLAVNGAAEVHGIDINIANLDIANEFKRETERRLKCEALPVSFTEMSAFKMDFPNEYFDVVVADNILEHIMDLDGMMLEIRRVLKRGGVLVAPSFNFIYSKHGLHLKHGLKIPWANVLFSERTICNVMQRLAIENPTLYTAYPGLRRHPTKVRDLREYRDLNGLTHKRFRKLVARHGFALSSLVINPAGNALLKIFYKLTYKLPILRESLWVDLTSVSAKSVMIKK